MHPIKCQSSKIVRFFKPFSVSAVTISQIARRVNVIVIRIESMTASFSILLRAPVAMEAVPSGKVIAHQLSENDGLSLIRNVIIFIMERRSHHMENPHRGIPIHSARSETLIRLVGDMCIMAITFTRIIAKIAVGVRPIIIVGAILPLGEEP